MLWTREKRADEAEIKQRFIDSSIGECISPTDEGGLGRHHGVCVWGPQSTDVSHTPAARKDIAGSSRSSSASTYLGHRAGECGQDERGAKRQVFRGECWTLELAFHVDPGGTCAVFTPQHARLYWERAWTFHQKRRRRRGGGEVRRVRAESWRRLPPLRLRAHRLGRLRPARERRRSPPFAHW